MDRQPNFLIFMTDQQRADHLSCMGNEVLQTPNIDRLAAEGVTFENHHVNNPVCMPSRATLFTGRTPRGHGVRSNGIPLDTRIPTMPAALSAAGYHTHNVGKVHLRPYQVYTGATPEELDPTECTEVRALWDRGLNSPVPPGYYGLDTCEITLGHGDYISGEYLNWLKKEHPEVLRFIGNTEARYLAPPTGADQSFRWALPEELHYSTWVADRTMAFLRERAGKQQPFFTFCSFPDPHHPFCPPAPWCDRYDPAEVPLPRARREGELAEMPWHYLKTYRKGMLTGGRMDKTEMPDENLREIIAHTYGLMGLVDKNVGRVLDELERLGLAENTVVVFLTDHGELLGDHGLLNKGPFLYRGLTQSPFIVRAPGQTQAGRRVRSLTSHLDFAPTILDVAGVEIPEGIVPPKCESPNEAPAWPGVSLRPLLDGSTDRLRDRVLVEYDEDYQGWHLRSLITEEFRVTMYGGETFGELFDLRKDPLELCNLWDAPEAKTSKQDALAQLLDEIVVTDSALPRRLAHA